MSRPNLALRCQVCRRLLTLSHIPEDYDARFAALCAASTGPADGGAPAGSAATSVGGEAQGGAGDGARASAADCTPPTGSEAGNVDAAAEGSTASTAAATGAGDDGGAHGLGTPEARASTAAQLQAKAEAGDSVQFVLTLSAFCAEALDTDLPLCDTCLDRVVDELSTEVKAAEALHADRLAYAEHLEATASPASDDSAELEVLATTEAALKAQQAALAEERAASVARGAALGLKERQVSDLERRAWVHLNQRTMERGRAQLQLLSFDTRRSRCKALLNHFHQINVFSDAFFVWHDGPFGTINGLRLGRLPIQPVEWTEINAALGFCVALLDGIAARARYKFRKLALVARGSFSRLIKRKDGRTAHDMYWDNRMFQTRRLNAALKSLLALVAEMCACAESADRSLRLPYHIADDRVAGFSITLGDDVEWTAALKGMVTLLKWLLAWVIRTPPRSTRPGSAVFGTLPSDAP